jgi:hypothetical protein
MNLIHMEFRAVGAFKKLGEMQEQLDVLRTYEIANEMFEWQSDEFKRKNSNLEVITNDTATSATTKFWDRPKKVKRGSDKIKKRYAMGRAVKKQILLGMWMKPETSTGKKRTRLYRPILRPELVVGLYLRIMLMARERCRWR